MILIYMDCVWSADLWLSYCGADSKIAYLQ